ncbi:MAG: hypothetical protein ABIJ61_11340 [bacterium]
MSSGSSTLPRANEITDLRLNEECWHALREIGLILESARLLKLILGVAPAARVLFAAPPAREITIHSADWQRLAKAVRSVDRLAAARCLDLAARQYATHSRDHGLRDFWENVVNIFQRSLAGR